MAFTWPNLATAIALAIILVLPLSSGLYFHIGETERKCFIEEIPDETMVTGTLWHLSKNKPLKFRSNSRFSGNYKVQLYDPRTNGFAPSSPGIGMHVEVRDPEDKIILSKVYSSEGKWTFTSHTPGEHVICLYTNSTKWFSGTQLVSFPWIYMKQKFHQIVILRNRYFHEMFAKNVWELEKE